MGVTLVSGVPGVGLSSICTQARRHVDEEYELVNFGDVMLEQAAMHDLATSRDELSSLTRRETRRLQRRTGEYVADRADEADVILATHLAVETDVGFVLGLPDDVLQAVDPDRFVLVEATPETVTARRERADRDYGDASSHAIEFEQDLNRSACVEYAAEVDAPIQLVRNQDDVDAAADTLVDMLESGD
jgi:adenylate kinase